MPRFRIRPIEIDALRFTHENWEKMLEFLKPELENKTAGMTMYSPSNMTMSILHVDRAHPRPDGIWLDATVGDWIIRNVVGEIFTCTPDVFEKTYELVKVDACPKCESTNVKTIRESVVYYARKDVELANCKVRACTHCGHHAQEVESQHLVEEAIQRWWNPNEHDIANPLRLSYDVFSPVRWTKS